MPPRKKEIASTKHAGVSPIHLAHYEDPLQAERDRLLASKDACVRVCGRVAECHELNSAQLIENVDPVDWERWLARTLENEQLHKRALRLGLARIEIELRAVALAITTRRGQVPMARLVWRAYRHRVYGDKEDQGPFASSSKIQGMTTGELETLAGEDDAEG